MNGNLQVTSERYNRGWIESEQENILIGNNEKGDQTFNGAMDDFQFFNFRLSEEEIQSYVDYQYQNPVPETTKLLNLPFESSPDNLVLIPGELVEQNTDKASDRFGNYEAALLFNSDEDLFKIESVDDRVDSLYLGVSVSAWIYIDKFSEGAVISRSDGTRGDQFRLYVSEKSGSSGNMINLYLNNELVSARSPALQRAQWVHIGATYDGERVSLYVNGSRIAEKDINPTKLWVTEGPLLIGGYDYQPWYFDEVVYQAFNGRIDEVQVYNYALSENHFVAAFEDRFTGFPADSTAVLDIGFDGSVENSESPNDSFEVFGGSYTENRFGEDGTAYSFDGQDDYIVLKDENTKLDSLSKGFTVASWVNMKRDKMYLDPMAILSRKDSQAQIIYLGIQDGYNLGRGPDWEKNAEMEAVVFKFGEGTTYFTDEPVQPGAWFHVAGTYDGKVLRLYLNGVKSDTLRYEGLVDISDSDLYIGTNDKQSRSFNGDLDDVRIYNYALSDSAIASMIDIETVAVPNDSEPVIPASYELSQNYPNPFNPVTSISYTLPEASDITLSVYNVTGQEVAVLEEGRKSSGSYTLSFDASGLASGIYFYQLKTGDQLITRKMILLK